MSRSTHTYSVADVSLATYAEIKRLLVDAGYQHAIHTDGSDEVLDMHGIALRVSPDAGDARFPATRPMREWLDAWRPA